MWAKAKLLLVGELARDFEDLEVSLQSMHDIHVATDMAQALSLLQVPDTTIDIVLFSLHEVPGNVQALLRSDILKSFPALVVAEPDHMDAAFTLLDEGVYDVVLRPVHLPSLLFSIERALRAKKNATLTSPQEAALQRRAATLRDWEEKLWQQTIRDELTGLYNKDAYFEFVHQRLEENSSTPYVIIQFDIQNFKLVNAMFGMGEGDAVLQHIASHLQAKYGDTGICARLSADQFSCCLPYTPEATTKFREDITLACQQYDIKFEIVLHFGFFVIDDLNLPVSVMSDRASLALRTIKGNYINNYAFYDDAQRQLLVEEQQIIQDMNIALTEKQFYVFYQPKYLLNTETIAGAEALVRWQHPTLKSISPSKFIPIFERNGFIQKLDYYVWENVCQTLRKWLDEGRAIYPISVNISRRDFYHPDIVSIIINLVEKYNLPHSLFELEITESAYTKDSQQLFESIDALRNAGFIFLMDDFGSGYSSLSALKELPVDVLKLDLRFLSGYGDKSRSISIIWSLIRMANWLEIPTIVEGVETDEDIQFLRSIGCNMVQGYYYSRPLPLQEYERLLDEQRGKPSPSTSKEQKKLFSRSGDLWQSSLETNWLLESIIGGLALCSFNNNILEILRTNSAFLDIIGCRRGPFTHHMLDMFSHVYPADRVLVINKLEETLSSYEQVHFKFRTTTNDGRERWLSAHACGVPHKLDPTFLYLRIHESD